MADLHVRLAPTMTRFSKRTPPYSHSHLLLRGYRLAWFQICLKEWEHSGAMTSDHQTQISYVVEKLKTDYGLGPAAIYVSPPNTNEEGILCVLTEDGVAVSTLIADWAVANLGVLRGPDTGPMGLSQLERDRKLWFRHP